MFWKTKSILMTTAAALSILSGTSCTMASATQFAIPPEDLGQALNDFARTTNVQVVVASDLVAGKTSAGTSGKLPPAQALAEILAGSGLHAEFVAGAYVVRPTPPLQVADGAPPGSPDIVVTGTRIHGEAPIGANLTVIDRKAIEDSGHATVADYIQTLPQNYSGGSNEANYLSNPHTQDNRGYGSSINLRGLGNESTLVLFDGNRPALGGALGAFVDTSLIPTSAIDRVEILADGASAIYGTDAVAGVVNVRFRDHYDGFETHIYQGVAGGALHQIQASQAAGKRWGTGGIFIAYQYDHRSRLSGDSRSFWTEDLSRYGGPENREPYSTPGTITAANGAVFAIPAGQDGRDLSPAQLLAGQANLTDQRRSIDILPVQTTHSVYAAVDQKIVGDFAAYGRVLYTHRAFGANEAPIYFQPYSVPVTNPFYVDPIGTDQPVSVDYDFSRELGHFRLDGTLNAVTASGGVKGTWEGWSFDLNGAYGHQSELEIQSNSASSSRVAIALADTNPATALNLFGDGTSNNPATLDFIRSSYRNFDRTTVWSTALRADGPLFDLPAGSVSASGQVVRALLRNDAAHPGFERLVKLGVAEHGVAEQSLPIQSVLASALERPDERHASLGFAEVAGSFARSVIELKLHGMNKTLAGVRSRASVVQPADLPAIPIAQAYVRLRSRVPLKQVCLPDSIGLHRILSARRMRSSLVIGVRLDPFMAHCWVQADAMVLNDSYDHVAAYTPILWI